MKNNKGITLISLIITIIVMVILAGITLLVSVREDGVIDKAEKSKRKMLEKQAEEMFLNDYNYIYIEENQRVDKLILSKYMNEEAEKLNVNICEIEEEGTNLIVTYEYPKNSGKMYRYELKILEGKLEKCIDFKGKTYIKTNLSQSEIFKNKEFTISARVKINRSEQSKVNYMNILGNHVGTTGFVWQFKEYSEELCVSKVYIDYKNYYDKWTDITMVYKNNEISAYINGICQGKVNTTYTSYGNLYIGNGYTGGVYPNREMKGQIQKVIVWNKALASEQINQLDFSNVNNKIENENILEEYNFESVEEITAKGTFVGSNYEILDIE